MTFDNQLPNHETFRCVACPGPAHLLPSFLNFKDVRIHSFKDHMVTMERGVKASTLLPTTLTIFMCKLCPEDDNKLFLTEELMKTHLVKHSNFFAARWKLFSELHCRVCEIVIDQDSDEDHMSSAHSKALFADIDDAIGVPDTNSYESKTIVEDLVFELVGLVCKEEEQIQNKESAEVKVKTEVFDDTEVDSLVDKSEDKNKCFRSSNSVIVGDGEKKTTDLVHDSSPLNSLADVIGKAEVSSSSSSQKLMLTSQGGLRLKPLAALFDQNKLNIGEKRKATKKKTKKSNAEIIRQVSASDVSPPEQGGSLENSQCLNCLKFRADCGQCRVCSDRSLIGNFSDICLKRRVVEKCEKLTGGTYRTSSWISEYCHKHEDVIKINKRSEAKQMSLLGIKKWVSAENIKNYISENGVEVSEVLICGGTGKVAFSNEEDALIWNSKDIFIIHDESKRINKCHIKSLKPENKLALLQSRKLHKLFVKGKASPFLKEVCYIGDTQLLPNEEAKGLLRNKENTLLQDKTNDLLVKEDMLEIFSKKEKAKDENKDDHYSEIKEDGSRFAEAYRRDSSRSQKEVCYIGDTQLLPNEEAKGLRNKENTLLQDKTNDLLVKEDMLEIFSKKEKAKDENKDDHYSEIKEDGRRFAEAYRRDSSRSQTINTRSQSEVGNRMEGIGTRGGCRGRSKSRCNVREKSRNSSRDRSRNRSRDRSRNRSRYRSRNRSRDRRKFRDLSNRSERKWSRDRRSTITSRRSRDRIRSRERRSRERRSRERRSRERRSRDRSRSRDRHRSRDRRSKERRRPRDRRRSRASRSRSRIMEGNNNKRKRSTSKECFEAGLGEFLKNISSSSGQVGN